MDDRLSDVATGFDADAWQAAHAASRQRWTFTHLGRTFTAADISIEQALDFVAAYGWATKAGSARQAEKVLRRFWYRVFPWRPSYLWRDPVRGIMGLEPAGREAILTDFFVSRGWRLTPPAPNETAAPLGSTRPAPW